MSKQASYKKKAEVETDSAKKQIFETKAVKWKQRREALEHILRTTPPTSPYLSAEESVKLREARSTNRTRGAGAQDQ
jgi:hypothetical protein